jgi:hypothetical protein
MSSNAQDENARTAGVTNALTAGFSYGTGAFRYDVTADRWWWSDEVYRMHGFEPGEVVPTTAMILAHKHPEDRERYAGALTTVSLLGGTFASVHRIIDAQGQERVLATIGEAHTSGPDAAVTEINGHFVDFSAPVRALAAAEATRQIAESNAHRAVIDQAMGVMAARTGVTVEEAFDLLRGASMRSNVKLRTLAERVVANARRGTAGTHVGLDAVIDLVADGPLTEPDAVKVVDGNR